jgi:hypothetical protein
MQGNSKNKHEMGMAPRAVY